MSEPRLRLAIFHHLTTTGWQDFDHRTIRGLQKASRRSLPVVVHHTQAEHPDIPVCQLLAVMSSDCRVLEAREHLHFRFHSHYADRAAVNSTVLRTSPVGHPSRQAGHSLRKEPACPSSHEEPACAMP